MSTYWIPKTYIGRIFDVATIVGIQVINGITHVPSGIFLIFSDTLDSSFLHDIYTFF